jgi:cytochrome c oxidase cbb3-type subunit III
MRNRRRSGRTASALLTFVFALGFASSPAGAQDAGRYEQTDIEYGARLFGMHCITCHGENGDLLPQINLRSGVFPNSPDDRELGDNIKNGIPGTAMIANAYSDSEIQALVAYVRNIGTFDPDSVSLGDAVRGQTFFEGEGRCGACHRLFGRGPRAAPDLSRIGAIRTAAQLERTLMGAEGGLIPINRPVRIVTESGSVINGRRLNEDRYTVQIVDDRGRLLSLDKAKIREYTIGTVSAAHAEPVTHDESVRSDLLAYLLSLKGLN